MILEFISIILLGYLLGAIPFGLLVGKLFRGIDLREYGSGNIGFANALRTVGGKAGITTLICDIGKGSVAVLLARSIAAGEVVGFGAFDLDFQSIQVAAGLAAVIGHNWPIYLKFKGGKGVDTSLGGLIAMFPWAGLACLAIGITVILTTRYVSLGSMVGASSSIVVLAPFVALGHQPAEFLVYGILVTILIVFQHRDNIGNLCSGTERRLGQKAEKK